MSFLKEMTYLRTLNLKPEKLIAVLSVLNNTGRKHKFRMILSYNYAVAVHDQSFQTNRSVYQRQPLLMFPTIKVFHTLEYLLPIVCNFGKFYLLLDGRSQKKLESC